MPLLHTNNSANGHQWARTPPSASWRFDSGREPERAPPRRRSPRRGGRSPSPRRSARGGDYSPRKDSRRDYDRRDRGDRDRSRSPDDRYEVIEGCIQTRSNHSAEIVMSRKNVKKVGRTALMVKTGKVILKTSSSPFDKQNSLIPWRQLPWILLPLHMVRI